MKRGEMQERLSLKDFSDLMLHKGESFTLVPSVLHQGMTLHLFWTLKAQNSPKSAPGAGPESAAACGLSDSLAGEQENMQSTSAPCHICKLPL